MMTLVYVARRLRMIISHQSQEAIMETVVISGDKKRKTTNAIEEPLPESPWIKQVPPPTTRLHLHKPQSLL